MSASNEPSSDQPSGLPPPVQATEHSPERKRGIGLTRDYERLPAVEAEIGRLPEVTNPGFRAAAEAAQAIDTVPMDTDMAEGLLAVLERDEGLREAFGRLKGNERLTARLLMEGLPDSSADPHEVSIAGVLGRTDRMVNNYKRQIKAILGPWLCDRGVPPKGYAPA